MATAIFFIIVGAARSRRLRLAFPTPYLTPQYMDIAGTPTRALSAHGPGYKKDRQRDPLGRSEKT